MYPWKEISLNEIKDIRIGHAQDEAHATGCTAILCEKKAVCGVDVRGGGPASRENQLLNPLMSNDGVHGVLLSGGSAFGLDAAGGMMKYLEEKGRGVKVGSAIVPIVVGSCIFDLGCVDGSVRPDAAMGYAACLDSERSIERNGNVGAGMGATVGKIMGDGFAMKSGLGCYAVQMGSLQVGAIVAVNAIGDVYELDSGRQLAGLLNKKKDGMLSSEIEAVKLLQLASKFSFNTTIGAVITNANLDKAAMNKVAAMAANGVARTIRPVNTSMDGDSIYALCTGKVKTSADVVGTIGAHVLGKAINRAVLEADEIHGYKSAKSFL
ncbi:MAG: P1 family peptidase [Clostridia bacterium]|nr:P1 family peptidase [Clostridia bacterium]MBQ6858160.1 P1 family peptidase [Clostridia bacterium]